MFVLRLMAWTAIAALIVLTVVPANLRPASLLPNGVAHFGSFFIASVLYYLGYPRQFLTSVIVAVTFVSAIEFVQILLPTRHARLVDLVVDALAASAGCVIGLLLIQTEIIQPTGKRRGP